MNIQKIKIILFNIVLMLLSFVTVVPFVWMLISSFAPNSEIVKIGGSLFPTPSTFSNYVNIQERFNFLGMFRNSLVIATTITAITIYTSALVGFVFAKFQSKCKIY